MTGAAPAVTTPDPARTFAPLVSLHPREEWLPIAADDFLDHATLKWNGACAYEDLAAGDVAIELAASDEVVPLDPARLGGAHPYRHRGLAGDCSRRVADAYAATEHTRPYDRWDRPAGLPPASGYYLDLLTEAGPGRPRLARHDGEAPLVRVPAYVERARDYVRGRPVLRLTYWLLFARSKPAGSWESVYRIVHEGDWERIDVVLRRGRGGSWYRPLALRYNVHDSDLEVPWRRVRRVPPGSDSASAVATHPVLFASHGGHVLYPREGRHRASYLVPAEARYVIDEVAVSCASCPRWETWRALVPAREQPWYGFGGAWGTVVEGTSGRSGPLGPSAYRLDAEATE